MFRFVMCGVVVASFELSGSALLAQTASGVASVEATSAARSSPTSASTTGARNRVPATAPTKATALRWRPIAPMGVPSAHWYRPVLSPVVRPFRAPASPYGPGHRGVDFRAVGGTAVRAAGPGRVIFAGRVAGVLHVVVEHPNGRWRSGYSFLDTVTVHVGEWVRGGHVIATAGSDNSHHRGGVLHFSLRIDGEYVDPLRLWSPPDLAEVVRLDRFDR